MVPAYNEERRLKASLSRIWDFLTRRFPSFELIVVDDGSTDGTATVVEEFATDHHSVELIAYQVNRGKGYAVRTGMLHASYDLMLFSDADLATPIEEVEVLLERIMAGSDVAIGSRMVAGSRSSRSDSPGTVSWPVGASIGWPSGWPRPGSSTRSAASNCSVARWRAIYSTA